MMYLYVVFGDGMAFAQTQSHWFIRPRLGLEDKILSLLSLEPFWSNYVPQYPWWWGSHANVPAPFNLHFVNPIMFAVSIGLIAIGARRAILTQDELVFAAMVLVIPYVTRAHEMAMASHSRFTVVCFPIYLVVGRLLAPVGAHYRTVLVVAAAVYCCCICAMFGKGLAIY
jgi:hypothetical protein